MEMRPLDEEIPVETYEAVKRQFEAAQDELIRKYDLPREQFVQELRRRLLAEEVFDEPAVTRWQMLYSAMLDWAREEIEPADPPPQTCETCHTKATLGRLKGVPNAYRDP